MVKFYRFIANLLRLIIIVCFGTISIPMVVYCQQNAPGAAKDDQGYRIDKPGTITFTVGVKIKGKLERPQVVIFLPKEKPVFRDVSITHSFYDAIMEPLPITAEGN
jgi:hypothetical protein